MNRFSYQNPTHLYFGEGQIAAITQAIPADKKVLVLYGGGSIKQNGVLNQVHKALAGHRYTEFGGIEPNPSYETLMKAVEQIRRDGSDYLLAVGGGSVLDGSKFVAAAACYDGADPWDIVEKGLPIPRALPMGCVLTLPATGSESNGGGVITHRAKNAKLPFSSPQTFPTFAVLDPTTTYSLPPKQIANGIVDAYVHVMEQYLTFPAQGSVQDRYAEGLLQTLIEIAPTTLQNPTDYASRANFMWAANQALNGLIGVGVPQDWSTHMIGHELTALYGLDHAQTLAVVLPHSLRLRRQAKRAKLLQYAKRVWNIQGESTQTSAETVVFNAQCSIEGCTPMSSGADNDDFIIETAIRRTEQFFESTGLATKLSALGIEKSAADKVANRLKERGFTQLGEKGEVTPEVAHQILTLSLK